MGNDDKRHYLDMLVLMDLLIDKTIAINEWTTDGLTCIIAVQRMASIKYDLSLNPANYKYCEQYADCLDVPACYSLMKIY